MTVLFKLKNNSHEDNITNPADIQSMKKELEKDDIVLEGCLITNHNPKWKCGDCNHKWGEREE